MAESPYWIGRPAAIKSTSLLAMPAPGTVDYVFLQFPEVGDLRAAIHGLQ
jgi:hypothetical protein